MFENKCFTRKIFTFSVNLINGIRIYHQSTLFRYWNGHFLGSVYKMCVSGCRLKQYERQI